MAFKVWDGRKKIDGQEKWRTDSGITSKIMDKRNPKAAKEKK